MGKGSLQGDKENAREWLTELLSPTFQDYRAEKAEGTKNSPDFKEVGVGAIIEHLPHARYLAYISSFNLYNSSRLMLLIPLLTDINYFNYGK